MNTGDSVKLKSIASSAADHLLRHPWKIWFWGDSIGIEGLLDASEITGDGRFASYVHGLMKGWAARQEARNKFDYCFAGVGLLRCYELTGDSTLLEAAIRQAEYLAGFRKLPNGVQVRYLDAEIELPPELPPDHPDYHLTQAKASNVSNAGPCVFVDTVHFDGPFFSKLYRITDDKRWKQLALDNLLGAIELLFDNDAGLFYHFWIENENRPNGVFWGRGNGWGMLGVLHTLLNLDADDPEREKLIELYWKQAKSMAKLQTPSGDWRTVLDDPEAYIEPSIAAFMVEGFGIGIINGWLSADYLPLINLAMEAILTHVEPDGKFADVSYETFPSTRPEHYRSMPQGAVVPWGQGPLISAIKTYMAMN